MDHLFRVLRRTVVLECYANRIARGVLRDIVEPLKTMVGEMVEYALKHNTSQKALHRIFYERYRREYPWIPARVIKGAYRGAVRRAKSFRERLKKGKAYTKKRIDGHSPLLIRAAVRGASGRFKVVKIVLRITYVDGRIVERDVVGAINIGLKHLSSNGNPMVLGSTGAHEVWVKHVNSHLGLTPLTEIQVFGNTLKYC